MRSSLTYESEKMKKDFNHLLGWIIISQVFSLIFFSSVSVLETIEADTILKNVQGISSLSTAITLIIVTIYAVMVINKVLVIKYIGNFRERTYTYPTGRTQILKDKIDAFLSNYLVKFVACVFTMNMAYYFICTIIPFIKLTTPIYSLLAQLFLFTLFSACISIMIILLAVVFGIYAQSTHKCLIIAIILVALLGNVVASAYHLHAFFLMIGNLILCIVICLLVQLIRKYVELDHLLDR